MISFLSEKILGVILKIKNATWLILYYNRYCKVFLQYEIKRLRPYKFREWKSEVKYFIGRDQNKIQLFLKIDSRWKNIESEVNGIKKVCRLNSKYFPSIHSYSVSNIKFVAFKYIDGQSFNTYMQLDTTIKRILIQDLEIINKILLESNIIHRDIGPRNIMILKENERTFQLKLIDFSFCIDKADSNSINEEKNRLSSKKYSNHIKNLGYGFSPGLHFWDDSYSLFKITELLGSGSEMIYKNIGKLEFKL